MLHRKQIYKHHSCEICSSLLNRDTVRLNFGMTVHPLILLALDSIETGEKREKGKMKPILILCFLDKSVKINHHCFSTFILQNLHIGTTDAKNSKCNMKQTYLAFVSIKDYISI